ncbi:MAG: hypothetical protein PVI78_13090 [Anaerolineales bacterium]|jgi:hypothetical protein
MSAQVPEDLETAITKAQAVKQAYETELLRKSNVVGVGVGLCLRDGKPTGEVGLVVLVRNKLPSSEIDPEDVIPREIQSVPVDVQEVGEIRPLQQDS